MFKRFFSEKSWHRQNLAGIASIEFPERPEVKQSTGIIQIGLYNKPTYFLVDIEDLSNYPGVEVSKDELQNLYLGIQTGYFQNPNLGWLTRLHLSWQIFWGYKANMLQVQERNHLSG